jgi:uncharacterized small protein (DUF1192 family)
MIQQYTTRLYLLTTLFLSNSQFATAQSVGINNTGAAAHPSAMLDVSANNKGILIPRLTATERDAISSPATGLMVYQTDGTTGFYYYTGTAWQHISSSGSSSDTTWDTTGEGHIHNANTGNVGIGTTTPAARLHVADSSVVFTGPEVVYYDPPTAVHPPISGFGSRMMWYADKAAFRCGSVGENRWHRDSIGVWSVAMGANSMASGIASLAIGESTTAGGYQSVALGGLTIASGLAAIATGNSTTASGYISTAMGIRSVASGNFSTSMGYFTTASGNVATAMGNESTASGENSTAMGKNTIASGMNTTAAGFATSASGENATAMGYNTTASGGLSVSMGAGTIASGGISVAMGQGTTAAGEISVAMGSHTSASGNNSTAMGLSTTASGHYSTATGFSTSASGEGSTAMGYNTTAEGLRSFAIGSGAIAAGQYSFALGTAVNSTHIGSFVIGDASAGTFTYSSADAEMTMRFSGGYRLFTNNEATIGAHLAPGANSWSTISDRRRKENFAATDGEAFLKKIAQFNLTSWNYKGQNPAYHRHYGPMAQDFYAAFGTDSYGTIGNDTTISQADMEGVSLIAIQALEKRTQEIAILKNEIENLKAQLKKTESLNTELNASVTRNNNRLDAIEAELSKTKISEK